MPPKPKKLAELGRVVDLPHGPGAELGRRLQHHDAGHQRAAGDVPARPERVFFDLEHAGDFAGLAVEVADARELFHLVALGVGLPDRLDVGEDGLGVDLLDGNQGPRRHALLLVGAGE
jgi:hypothetical protein